MLSESPLVSLHFLDRLEERVVKEWVVRVKVVLSEYPLGVESLFTRLPRLVLFWETGFRLQDASFYFYFYFGRPASAGRRCGGYVGG